MEALFLWRSARRGIPESRYVPALLENDLDGILGTHLPVIFLQLVTETARFHAHDRVDLRIGASFAIEYFASDGLFVDLIDVATQRIRSEQRCGLRGSSPTLHGSGLRKAGRLGPEDRPPRQLNYLPFRYVLGLIAGQAYHMQPLRCGE